MQTVDVVTTFLVLTLVGVEFSVSAFVHPAAQHLQPEPRLQLLSRFALVLGNVMPVWYPVCTLLLAVVTWLHWNIGGRELLLTADAIWVATSVLSLVLLVPLNSQIAQAAADWQRIHHLWDRRHRIRIAALSLAALLLLTALVR